LFARKALLHDTRQPKTTFVLEDKKALLYETAKKNRRQQCQID
jgi:hypothetical protein